MWTTELMGWSPGLNKNRKTWKGCELWYSAPYYFIQAVVVPSTMMITLNYEPS